MDNIRFFYSEFENQIKDIEDYMKSIELQKAMIREMKERGNDLKDLNYTKQYCYAIKNVVASPIQYNAIIISIYGCFEHYIDEVFNSYMNNICEIINNYEEFPERLREKQIKKLGDFLVNPKRYKNYSLSIEDAIENVYKYLLLNHGGNLKIDQISELAKEFGINDFINKIVQNYGFMSYFVRNGLHNEDTYRRTASQNPKNLFEKLEWFVSARNDVAHGWVEERMELNAISENYLGFLKILAYAINEIMLQSFMSFLMEREKLCKLGKAIKVIDSHIVCINNGDNIFGIGDYLIAVKNKKIKVLEIKTLQINGKSIERLEKTNNDVGIGLEKRDDIKINQEYSFYLCKYN